MAPTRRSAPAEEEEAQEPEQELVTLKFKDAITWRPGKAIPIDQLLKRLDKLSSELSDMDQETADEGPINKIAKEVASHQLLSHKDKGVRAYVACCIVDILRICAPNAPFTPSQLKDIFNLTINSIIPALFDPTHPYNNQHKHVLRSFAEIKSIVLVLDVDGYETLLLNLFTTIFDGVSKARPSSGEQVGKDVEFTMQEMLGVLIDDVTSLPAQVVDIMMAQFLRAAAPGGKDNGDHVPLDENQATLLLKEEPEAYQMAKNLCLQYPEKMARLVSQYFSDVIVDATSFMGRANGHRDDYDDDEDGPSGPTEADLKELRKAHTLIREVWKAAPMILQNVVPQVDAELNADNVHLRQLATETLGDMISGIGAAGPPPLPRLDPTAYPPLRLDGEDRVDVPITNILTTPMSAISFPQTHSQTFHKFLSRKNDKAGAIRASWTTAVGYILSTSAGGIGLSREDETELIRGLGEKLSDTDEKVRLAAVKAIESFRFQDIISKLAPNGGVHKEGSVLSTLADRCRDRKPAVRVAAMALLGRLWAAATGELLAGNEVVKTALSGIPSRIYSTFYANDLELNVLLERVVYEFLVPLNYPPQKKGPKGASSNGNSQQQTANAALDQDAIRAERILLLVRGLDESARRVFFSMQARQPQFATALSVFLKVCDQYNGGVMEEGADKITEGLQKAASNIARFLPEEGKSKADLVRFAKVNDRRNYNLVKYVIGPEHDFKTVYKALKELIKRIQGSKEPGIMDTLLPVLYRSGCFMFNRSHLSTIMEYSRTDKDGLGGVAHEILNEISQKNPQLFKSHIGQLCKDLVDQAPSATKENDSVVVETLKACSTYARKYPNDVPEDREFTQKMINYALYGQPARAAKYAVNILLAKKDEKSETSATDLMQRIMKDWTYGSKNFLNKLAAVSQLELLASKVTAEYDDKILNLTVQQILLQVRADAHDKDPNWVEDADMDEECQAKCLSLKVLANRLRSMEDVNEAKEKAKPVWSLFKKLITQDGELCKTKDTPKHHRSRLRLLAAQLFLKLCTQKHFDDILTAADFNKLALFTQDAVQEVRHAFIAKLQKYLAEGKLRSRFYTIVFLTAFEPNPQFKTRTETWIRSRARYFQGLKQHVLEATMARLLSLLAHHPDYNDDLDSLIDHARYILFYVSLVATEANLGLIFKYAERIKQTKDTLDPNSVAHRVLSDVAQAVIRKWQEKKNWVLGVWPDKVGLPLGLFSVLQSHSEAQAFAEKQYTPEGFDDKLDEVFRALDRKKKRKSVDEGASHPPSKKARATAQPKAPKATKTGAPKKAAVTPKPKKAATKPKRATSSPVVPDTDRRRSGRSRKSNTYIERDSSEDDEEMLDGVAEWEYEGGSGDERADKGDKEEDVDAPPEDEEEATAAEEEDQVVEDEEEEEAPSTRRGGRVTKKTAPAAAALPSRAKKAAPAPAPKKGGSKRAAKETEDDESELSDPAPSDEEKEEEQEQVEEDGDDAKSSSVSPAPSSPPATSKAANGRRAVASAGGKGKATKAQPKAAPKVAPKGKAKAAAPAPARATRGVRGKKVLSEETVDAMDEDSD
ncbi:Armadillo-type fold [Rhypophila decipiens]